eukprot:268537-Prymnesium_polylepis.1
MSWHPQLSTSTRRSALIAATITAAVAADAAIAGAFSAATTDGRFKPTRSTPAGCGECSADIVPARACAVL